MAWRGFLAILLSLLILFLWPVVAKNIFHYPSEPQEVTNQTTSSIFRSLPSTSTSPSLETVEETTMVTPDEKIELEKQEEVSEEPAKKPLGSISRVLLKILTFLHNLLNNWGLAIIGLSFLIWLVFFPLTSKSMKAMKRMQDLQPKIEHLRQSYKDNPQRLNKEIMQLYRDERVNPFGGCLPILLQLPIFIGLYQMLLRSDVLTGANFLWINDLSKPDQIFTIEGFPINILPIITALLMYLQQKHTLKSASGAQADQQKMMSYIMPVMFGFIFYRMPSGLVLYWLVNSLLMLVGHWKMSRDTARAA